MLSNSSRSSGFSLIELMIAIVIFTISITLGISSYRTWVQNTQIRNAAESIHLGIQRARAEAVKRNSNVEFILLGASPDWVASWTVRTPLETIESSSGREGSKNVFARGYDKDGNDASTVTFNNLASVTNNADASESLRRIALESTVLDAADSRDLEIRVGIGGVGGNVRMCDPNLAAPSPMACN